MNRAEAAEILMSWRPGIDDADPRFSAALAFAKTDPELSRWLEEERDRYMAVRSKLKEISVPEDLARTIIAQRPIPMKPRGNLSEALKLAAVIALFGGVAAYWFWPSPGNNLAHYEDYLTKVVVPGYRMSLETNDPEQIRRFLASKQAPADYALPKPLEHATPLGCAMASWNGKLVSMLCFRAAPGRDLYLFVVDRAAVTTWTSAQPEVRQQGDFSEASWESGGKDYVLTVKGSPEVVKSYL